MSTLVALLGRGCRWNERHRVHLLPLSEVRQRRWLEGRRWKQSMLLGKLLGLLHCLLCLMHLLHLER